MSTTHIEWTRGDDGTPGVVWNPTTGCDKVSPGCGLPRWDGDDTGGCYALAMAKRLKAMGQAKYQNDGDPRTSGPGFGLAVHEDALTIPLRWQKPRRVFVNSMSDLFHARVPREFVARVWAVMAATPQHTYQVLTKRPRRAAQLLTDRCTCGAGHTDGVHFRSAMEWAATPHSPTYVSGLSSGIYHRMTWPLPNVWLGTSVEDQKRADERIPALLNTPAAVRWLSCEPLLGHVDLQAHLYPTPCSAGCGCRLPHDPDRRECGCDSDCTMHPDWPFDSGIHWVVAGGESGPGARPMHPWWIDDLRHQCTSLGVPFFFKQWGAWRPVRAGDPHTAQVDHHGLINGTQPMARVGKAAAGRELDGRTWDEFPVGGDR